MKITPRAHEVSAVIDVLNDPDPFDRRKKNPDYQVTADDMAKAVIKTVAHIIGMREELWAIGLGSKPGGLSVNFGPYGSSSDAQRAASKLAGASTEIRIVRLGGADLLTAKDEGAFWKGFCKCGHIKETHINDGSSRGQCALTECECHKWREIK